ncbi:MULTISPECIES: phosphoribosyltransferase family protein [Edwardsiella]|uniref:Double zinc ribbon domain-containing protein n=1 Tax=Edwardsiella anguillarum TaxID=1821960 RepID=A0ABY8SDW8_9GAMM|nr:MULTISPECIES: phosphoribosyltransferase family protein [Edwardsiella]AKR79057.1 double zinc ribbon domain-containing protein [Edwardsiella sp. LADL05-105]UOU79263.1 double zinc ribbon domain-containing protein [Edwardsiella anguillarum]WHP80105.1 double zinc ribbon domain-containing protein [Edwardsiella anguillarum]WHP83695.1 double zinc ribbon domain-containing protein [Edwardsiella anguillarum]WHP87485.1 double zinc ribbon domain-containing protein [Edwardsiella anguillarum]
MVSLHGRCAICRLPLRAPVGICSACRRALPAPPPCCPRCGLPSADIHHPCGRCLLRPPPWQRLTFVSGYLPPLAPLVQRLKYRAEWPLAVPLARLMLLRYLQDRRSAPRARPEIILPVPLHRLRHWQRGYNQAAELARWLARWLQAEFRPQWLWRIRRTPPQQGLSAAQRRRNLRGAFAAHRALAGRRVLLVDDVITTGSTLSEISRLLIAQGVMSVETICLCRTL